MGYIGVEMQDMLIQKTYNKLVERGYKYPLSSCYYSLLGVLQREGQEALDEYVKSVKFQKKV